MSPGPVGPAGAPPRRSAGVGRRDPRRHPRHRRAGVRRARTTARCRGARPAGTTASGSTTSAAAGASCAGSPSRWAPTTATAPTSPIRCCCMPPSRTLIAISARRSARRRDRFTARLPMLSPPHQEGGIGALRVEVRGAPPRRRARVPDRRCRRAGRHRGRRHGGGLHDARCSTAGCRTASWSPASRGCRRCAALDGRVVRRAAAGVHRRRPHAAESSSTGDEAGDQICVGSDCVGCAPARVEPARVRRLERSAELARARRAAPRR